MNDFSEALTMLQCKTMLKFTGERQRKTTELYPIATYSYKINWLQWNFYAALLKLRLEGQLHHCEQHSKVVDGTEMYGHLA